MNLHSIYRRNIKLGEFMSKSPYSSIIKIAIENQTNKRITKIISSLNFTFMFKFLLFSQHF